MNADCWETLAFVCMTKVISVCRVSLMYIGSLGVR